jgi:hypothetical protein
MHADMHYLHFLHHSSSNTDRELHHVALWSVKYLDNQRMSQGITMKHGNAVKEFGHSLLIFTSSYSSLFLKLKTV